MSKNLVRTRLAEPLTGQSANFRFDTPFSQDELKRKTVRGGAAVLVSQVIRFAVHLVSMIALARLLTPADFGLIAMIAPIVHFVGQFNDLGLSKATVQRPQITPSQVSTLFWINTAIGLLIMLLMIGLSPVFMWFFGEQRLGGIVAALAVTMLMAAMSNQHIALLKRQMEFGRIAAIELTAAIAGALSAILAAWCGLRYWSLVILAGVRGLTHLLMSWQLAGWMPGRPARDAGVRSMIAFGGHVMGFNLVNFLARNLDNVLIGRAWGSVALGLYSQAYQLLLLPISQINGPLSSVAVPALSRLQNQPEQYRRFYCKSIGLIATLGMPVVAFCFVAVEGLILTMLGEQWLEAAPIFRALGPAAFVGTFNVCTVWVYLSWGHTQRMFRWGLVSSGVTVAAFFVGLPYGPLGVATAYSIANVLVRWPGIVICFRDTPLKPTDLLRALWRPAVVSLASAAVVFLARGAFAGSIVPPVLTLSRDFFTYCTIFVLLWLLIPGGAHQFRTMAHLVSNFRRSTDSGKHSNGGAELP